MCEYVLNQDNCIIAFKVLNSNSSNMDFLSTECCEISKMKAKQLILCCMCYVNIDDIEIIRYTKHYSPYYYTYYTLCLHLKKIAV